MLNRENCFLWNAPISNPVAALILMPIHLTSADLLPGGKAITTDISCLGYISVRKANLMLTTAIIWIIF
jgi:hypothetical protein